MTARRDVRRTLVLQHATLLITFGAVLISFQSSHAQGRTSNATAPGSTSLEKASQATALTVTVTDPSGSLVADAAVHIASSNTALSGSTAVSVDFVTDRGGRCSVSVPPGKYDISTVANGFDPLQRTVEVGSQPLALSFRLVISTASTQVNVASVDVGNTAASENKSALVFKGEQLDTLSSNDSTMQMEVQAMSGGSGQIYVDGFSGGRFPPKDSIREIRINQNPFSPQYEDLGYGRIEILTKPGSNKLHGDFFSSGSTKSFNSLNPYTGSEPPYFLLFSRGDVNGPIGRKTSFFLSGDRSDQHNNVVVNAFNPGRHNTVSGRSRTAKSVQLLRTPGPAAQYEQHLRWPL